jgi:hypothetical protein
MAGLAFIVTTVLSRRRLGMVATKDVALRGARMIILDISLSPKEQVRDIPLVTTAMQRHYEV